MKTLGPLRTSSGSSLMSTMVGLALGMIGILAMLSVFQTMAKANAGAGASATADGSIASGMLGAQIDIQKAGFGIESTTNSCLGSSTAGPSGTGNTDLVLISGAQLSGSGVMTGSEQTITGTPIAGNAVVWHWIENGNEQCQGLLATAGGLLTLAPVACDSAHEWSSLAWTSAPLIETGTISSFPADPNDTSNPFSQSGFFKATSSACSPFGKASGSTSARVSFAAGNRFTGGASIASVCIPNICK